MACLEGWRRKTAWQHSSSLQSCIRTDHRTSGTMNFGWKRPKWSCLVRMHSIPFGENQTLLSTNTSDQLPSTVVEMCWFGLVLQSQDQDNLQSLSRSLTIMNMWGHLSESLSLAAVRSSKTTMIPNTAANLQQNDWKRQKSKCLVKSLQSDWITETGH